MKVWTPDVLFAVTWCVAALSGLAALLNSNKALSIRSVSAAMTLNGLAGCGLGMVGYEYLGGADHPWRVVGMGMLVGIKVVKLNDVRAFILRSLGDTQNADGRDKN